MRSGRLPLRFAGADDSYVRALRLGASVRRSVKQFSTRKAAISKLSQKRRLWQCASESPKPIIDALQVR